jgi:hypothetical protein
VCYCHWRRAENSWVDEKPQGAHAGQNIRKQDHQTTAKGITHLGEPLQWKCLPRSDDHAPTRGPPLERPGRPPNLASARKVLQIRQPPGGQFAPRRKHYTSAAAPYLGAADGRSGLTGAQLIKNVMADSIHSFEPLGPEWTDIISMIMSGIANIG